MAKEILQFHHGVVAPAQALVLQMRNAIYQSHLKADEPKEIRGKDATKQHAPNRFRGFQSIRTERLLLFTAGLFLSSPNHQDPRLGDLQLSAVDMMVYKAPRMD